MREARACESVRLWEVVACRRPGVWGAEEARFEPSLTVDVVHIIFFVLWFRRLVPHSPTDSLVHYFRVVYSPIRPLGLDLVVHLVTLQDYEREVVVGEGLN